MSGADLYALYQGLNAKSRRVAFGWALYGQPTIPDAYQGECWAAMADFRAAVTESPVKVINDFLALTGSKSRVGEGVQPGTKH